MAEQKTLTINYTPSKRQTLFHTSEAFETLYGGAAGGGKTAALCAEAITLCFEYPGITVYYFRRTYPELEATAVKEIQKQTAEMIEAGLIKYNGQKHVFEFHNKSQIQLAYCEHPDDVFRYQSAEFQVLMIDELTHFPRETYDYLKTRVRSSNPKFPQKIMCATNPGNIGHGWVKQRFILDCEPEVLYVDEESNHRLQERKIDPKMSRYKSTRIFIPAKVSDHPDPEFISSYTAGLEGVANPDLKRALLEGDWDQFSGQAFTEFRRETHTCPPFSVEYHWPRWMSYDWGYGSYAAALWFTKDPSSKRVYVYRELYVSKMALSDQASLILDYDRSENIRQRLADPSIWKQPASAETGESIAAVFAKNKVFFAPANNNRAAGKMAWHDYLQIGDDGFPKLQIFTNCTNLIRTLPELPYDQHNPEDVDTDAEDHLYDAGRYGLVNQINVSFRKPKQKKKWDKVTGRLLS